MAPFQTKCSRNHNDMALDSRTPLLQGEPRSEISELDDGGSRRGLVRRESKREMGHREEHSGNGDVVRDVIIGFADGLTVPFALTAGLSSLGSSKLVILGGMAELFSGAISMGLGAYLAAVTERDHYICEEARERREVDERPEDEEEEIFEILGEYGVEREKTRPFVDGLIGDKEMWIKFMMDFELKLEKPNVSRAWISAATMGAAYFIGGLIPMIPYFFIKNVTHALFVSIGITVVILLAFGYIKNYVTIGTSRAGAYGAIQTLVIGVLAAGTSYGIVRALDSRSPADPGSL